ncbi:Uncharacterised protein [Burkholderia mallei]|nr:hypothetical protein DM55_4676 [Burkholderia mallei]AIO60343.1 hypothetical protein DM76_3629 [Burkholderia mallei]SQA73774.1 Uncharacterised protein [Burkholderia mallei]
MRTGCLPDARAGAATRKVKGKAYRGIARIPFSCPIGAFVRPVRGCAVGSPSRDAAMRGATRAAISPEWKHAARAAAAAQSQCAAPDGAPETASDPRGPEVSGIPCVRRVEIRTPMLNRSGESSANCGSANCVIALFQSCREPVHLATALRSASQISLSAAAWQRSTCRAPRAPASTLHQRSERRDARARPRAGQFAPSRGCLLPFAFCLLPFALPLAPCSLLPALRSSLFAPAPATRIRNPSLHLHLHLHLHLQPATCNLQPATCKQFSISPCAAIGFAAPC